MARVPKNQIIEGIDAQEGEFVVASNGLPYEGKYHIINGIAYAGENEQTNKVPIPLDQVEDNSLAGIISAVGYATAAYAMVRSNINMIQQTAEKFFPKANVLPDDAEGTPVRTGKSSFTQKTNDSNKIIKEIKFSSNYMLITDQLKKDPLYKIVEINFDLPNVAQQLDDGEKIIPGLKTFVNAIKNENNEY